MAQPFSSIGQTLTDYGGEKSKYALTVLDITAANYVAQTTLYTNLFTAIAALVLGNVSGQRIVAKETAPDVSLPSDQSAQRENKWLVRYHDTSGRRFNSELPTADLSLLANNSEFLVISGGVGATFKTAFEAAIVSPSDQSAVVVDSIQFVGRRS